MDWRRTEQKAHVHFGQIIELALQDQVTVQFTLVGVICVEFSVEFEVESGFGSALVGDNLVDGATQPI